MSVDVNTKSTETSPVLLTESAVNELKQIMIEQNIPADHGLRVGVKGGGCSGLSYILGFDAEKDGDQQFHYKDIKILINKSHGMYLAGMEIDYFDDLNNRGFIFNNPNATETCGCGSSFA